MTTKVRQAYKEKIAGVYVMEWPDGSWYVGQSLDLDNRARRHKSLLAHEQKSAPVGLQEAYDRNGKQQPTTTIIAFAESQEIRDLIEHAYLNNRLDKHCCNIQGVVKQMDLSSTNPKQMVHFRISQLTDQILELTTKLTEM